MKQSFNFIDLSSILENDNLNTSISKISDKTMKRGKYTTWVQKQRPNHQKLKFELPQTIEKSFQIMQPSQLQKDIFICIKDSLKEIEELKKTYSNISDERKKYKDIVEWLKFMLTQFLSKQKLKDKEHSSVKKDREEGDKYLTDLHNIYSSAVYEIIKELKEENLEKACLIKISWESVTNFHNTLVSQFQKEMEEQKKDIHKKYKLEQELYDKQIEELQVRLERAVFELAKRERYFYQVVRDNRILRKRVTKLMERIQSEIESNSYLKQENIIFYKENQRLKLAIEAEVVEERYQQVLSKLDDIEKQFTKRKKKDNIANITKQLKEKQKKNRDIIQKQINQIIKRVNASDFLDLDMATLPSSEDLTKLCHGISVQTQPMVQSIGINTYMNIMKRAIGVQFNCERKKFVITEEMNIMIHPLTLLINGQFQSSKKGSNQNSASDRSLRKGKKVLKDRISKRPSVYVDMKSIKQNIRNSSMHATNLNNDKKSERFSLAPKSLLPNINNKEKTSEGSQSRFSTTIHPLSSLNKSNLDFMRSSVSQKRDLRKSSFVMKNLTSKLSFSRHKSGEFEEDSIINNIDQSSEAAENEVVEQKNSKSNIQTLEQFVKEEQQEEQTEQVPITKNVRSSVQYSIGTKKSKKNRASKKAKTSKIQFNINDEKRNNSQIVENLGIKQFEEHVHQDSDMTINHPKREGMRKISQPQCMDNLTKVQTNIQILKAKTAKQSKIITFREQVIEEQLTKLTSNNSTSSININNPKVKNATKPKNKSVKLKDKKDTKKNANALQSNNTDELQILKDKSQGLKQRNIESIKTIYPMKSDNKLSFHQSTSVSNAFTTTVSMKKAQRSASSDFKTSDKSKQKSQPKTSDQFSESNMIKMFKRINQQILIHKNNLLRQQISFEEFMQMSMSRIYGLKILTIQMKQKLKVSLGKYKGSEIIMQVFRKLIQGQQSNPNSVHYKRHIFRVYILILEFWNNYSNLDDFQTLCQSFMRDLISSFFNKSKTDKIITFFEMIEINNQYKMFTVMESVIETESQSLAFMNTVYNLQSVLSDRHSINSKQMLELIAIIETNKIQLHTKVSQIFKYGDTKSKTLPFFNLVLQLNKNSQADLINLEATIQNAYNLIYQSKYVETNLQDELKLLRIILPDSRYIRVLQSMETETLRQSQRLLYQLIKLEYSNKTIDNFSNQILGQQMTITHQLTTQAIITSTFGKI